MARTGKAENQQANKDFQAQGNKAYKTGQTSIGEFNKDRKTLEAGGDIGQNPWQSAPYLSNVNRLQANALNSENNAAQTELEQTNRRTGGLNSGATQYTIRDLGLQKMRLADQLSSQRYQQDFGNNLAWQQYLAQASLAPAQAEQGYYGTATGGRGTALDNLTKLGVASYGPWQAAISAAGGAAAAAIGKKKGEG